MMDNSYFQQVNRRLAAAHFFLEDSAKQHANRNPVIQTAIKEATQFQLYYAFVAYLYELLGYYQRKVAEPVNSNLSHLLADAETLFEGVSEFVTLQQWSMARGNILAVLAELPSNVLALQDNHSEDDYVSANVKNAVNNDLLASDKQASFDINKISDLRSLLDDFQSLIASQRRNQVEY